MKTFLVTIAVWVEAEQDLVARTDVYEAIQNGTLRINLEDTEAEEWIEQE